MKIFLIPGPRGQEGQRGAQGIKGPTGPAGPAGQAGQHGSQGQKGDWDRHLVRYIPWFCAIVPKRYTKIWVQRT